VQKESPPGQSRWWGEDVRGGQDGASLRFMGNRRYPRKPSKEVAEAHREQKKKEGLGGREHINRIYTLRGGNEKGGTRLVLRKTQGDKTLLITLWG